MFVARGALIEVMKLQSYLVNQSLLQSMFHCPIFYYSLNFFICLAAISVAVYGPMGIKVGRELGDGYKIRVFFG